MKFGRNETEKAITLSLAPDGKWMMLRLSDTGPGIPRHALKKVFEDFFRGENDLTRKTAEPESAWPLSASSSGPWEGMSQRKITVAPDAR